MKPPKPLYFKGIFPLFPRDSPTISALLCVSHLTWDLFFNSLFALGFVNAPTVAPNAVPSAFSFDSSILPMRRAHPLRFQPHTRARARARIFSSTSIKYISIFTVDFLNTLSVCILRTAFAQNVYATAKKEKLGATCARTFIFLYEKMRENRAIFSNIQLA